MRPNLWNISNVPVTTTPNASSFVLHSGCNVEDRKMNGHDGNVAFKCTYNDESK